VACIARSGRFRRIVNFPQIFGTSFWAVATGLAFIAFDIAIVADVLAQAPDFDSLTYRIAVH
jgi:hypothetical protein